MRTGKWARLKTKVLHRDGWRCQYCGVGLRRDTATVDHLAPRVLGGTNTPSNLVACCVACNEDKADALPLEFLWVYGVRFRRDASTITNGRRAMG